MAGCSRLRAFAVVGLFLMPGLPLLLFFFSYRLPSSIPAPTSHHVLSLKTPARVVAPAGQKLLQLQTPYGNITIAFSPSAPNTVASITSSLPHSPCSSCIFVRNEAPPPASRPSGPPYALLQGQLPHILDCTLPVEPSATIRKGDVAAINGAANTNGEFFISLGSHDGWSASFTVWGHVSSGMHVVERIVEGAYTETVHASGTVMRLLKQPVAFGVAMLQL
jgi:cyclophilin family peptidyl-prolyl cis-trans isomerase